MRQKIILIGSGGSGKSTLARTIGKVLCIPVYHLDALFWTAGWVAPTRENWIKTQEKLCAEESWILDGNYTGTLDLRFSAADTIIFLDLSRWLCLYRTLKRTLFQLGRTRADMAPGCPERLNFDYLKFLKWIWDYPRTRRPGILEKLEKLRGEKEIVILKSSREVSSFVTALFA